MSCARRRILVCTYHKSGTVLFEHVMRRVAARFGLRAGTRYGLITALDAGTDIVIAAHALLGLTLWQPFRGVRIVRDPRDIWVSGYLYHRRCREEWCVSTDFSLAAPIVFPRVDYSVQHRPERWKQAAIERLGGLSYQQNLLGRSQADGLAFELAGYTANTLDAMRLWRPRPEILDVRLEDIASGYDGAMLRIFQHLGFDPPQCAEAVACAAEEDVARMNDAAVAANPHIYGRQLSKWRQVLTPEQVAGFEARHGDMILALGYALATAKPGPPPPV